jgi:hypothetical protein
MHGSPHCSLLDLARLIDDAHADHLGNLAFYVVHEPPEIVLGLQDLEPDVHPCISLGGLEAPPEWDAFGVRVCGTAHFLDDSGRAASAIVSTYLVDRGGRSASLLRRGDEVTELPGPAVGRIPELCRSILAGPVERADP